MHRLRVATLAALVATGLVVASFLPLFYSARERSAQARLFENVEPLTEAASDVNTAMLDMEAGSRGYILTGNPRNFGPYFEGQREFGPALDRARRLAERTGGERRGQLAEVAAAAEAWQTHAAQAIQQLRDGGSLDMPAVLQQGSTLFDTYNAAYGPLEAGLKQDAEVQRALVRSAERELMSAVIGAGALIVVISVIFGGLLWQRSALLRRHEQAAHYARTLMDTLHDAVLVIDPRRQRLLDVNVAAERETGYSRAELLSMDAAGLGVPVPQDARLMGTPVPATQRDLHAYPAIWRRKDGREVAVELIDSPVEFDGRPVIVTTARDVSDRLQRESAERARHVAEAASQAKSEFLSRMSHELRTPLNAILGFGQLLALDELSAEQRESVDYVLKAGQHLLELINEVLDIARIEAGNIKLSTEPVELSEVVEEAVALVRPLAEARAIEFSDECSRMSGQFVLADRQRLKQVLLNLLSNAIKYNREHGTVTLTCAVERESMRLAVRDSGPGIPPEKQGRLFSAFDRLDAEQRGVEGTGLGLVLSLKLVEAMRGRLTVSSEVGVGSVFAVELPRVETPFASLEAAGNGEASRDVPTARAEELVHRVLYIEDNLSNLRLLERLIERRPGVALLSAMQGQLGLDLAREHLPDLILLDLQLPDLPGEQVLQRLQSDPRTSAIPVVVISADATPGQRERLTAAGARAFLTKPIGLQRFLALLDELLAPAHG